MLSITGAILDLTGARSIWAPVGRGSDVVPDKQAVVRRIVDPQGYELVAEVTIEEDADDVLEITQHPVEQGAAITDHAYKRPAEVRMRLGWSNWYAAQALNKVYSDILDLQSSRRPFTIETGKRSYSDMLVADIRQHTDAKFEYSLMVDITFRQIQLVDTQKTKTGGAAAASTQTGNQANPQSTQAATQSGTVNPQAVAKSDSQLVAGGAAFRYTL